MKKLGTIIGLVVALGVALPAEASSWTYPTTTTKGDIRTDTVACASGSKAKATIRHRFVRSGSSIWTVKSMSGTNPCKNSWLILTATYNTVDTACCAILNVAPGASFTWNEGTVRAYDFRYHLTNGWNIELNAIYICPDQRWPYDSIVSGKGIVTSAGAGDYCLRR